MLQDQGHQVFTPTLTGLAERSHLLSPSVNLDTHIDDVVNLIRWEELSEVVLCGHSYAGTVISGVADRVPDRIRSLVYLDAFVLDDGQCLHDLLPEEQKQQQLDGARSAGDGWKIPPIPGEFFQVNPQDLAWMNRQCTWHPLATVQQKIRLTGAGRQVQNVTFILATGYGHSPFPPSCEKAKARGWKTRSLPCGHDVMLDLPAELTQALLEAV